MQNTDIAKTARIEKHDGWDEIRHIEFVAWNIRLSGGPFDGRTKTTRTRREAREWCDEFGYQWR